jgi:uncharacterized membrane protein YhfC
MEILSITHFLNGFLMVSMPIGLTIYLVNHWKVSGRLWWIGAATFILSQVIHIPFNLASGKLLNLTGIRAWNPAYQLIFNAIFIGLSAGFFEEVARYLVLRWWAMDVRSWRNGVLFGTGHGGAEAIILGALVLYGYLQLTALRNADLSTIIPANQLALAQDQIREYWSVTWYYSLLGALERFLAIPNHIAMAVIVMQVFTRLQLRWLFVAIGYHALQDALGAVLFPTYFGVFWTEGLFCAFAILSVVILFALRNPEPLKNLSTITTVSAVCIPDPIDETLENLEKTRYYS